MTAQRRVPKRVINAMKVLRARAAFQTFSASGGDKQTAAIVEGTRAYRDAWIDPVFNELIEWMEGRVDIDRHDRFGPIAGAARDIYRLRKP